jgi:mono/diheme cytochrome c family protein
MSKVKKALKLASLALLGAVGIAGGLAAYVQIDGIPRYAHETPEIHVEVTAERVARGKKLSQLLCVGCHEDEKTHRLTGKRLADAPPELGDIWSKNITEHPTAGIGRWTDGELEYFLRTGVRPDGQYVPPWMIKLPHASDEDVHSIVAFLRSGDPLVAPSDVKPAGETKTTFLSKALAHGPFRPLPYPKEPIVAPPRSDRVAFGRYLVFNLDCFGCHSPDFKSMNVLEPEKTPGYMSGGNTLVGVDGAKIRTPNLTPDEETGIGAWTEQDFVRALRHGFRPDGRALSYPMLPRQELDDDEASAIYTYLRTVPKIRNAVPRPSPAVAGDPGRRAYERYGCSGCHGATGAGPGGDLRAANERYPTDEALRAWIEDAPSKKPGTKMPAWRGVIRDDDYAPLMAYVRTLARPGKQASREPAPSGP